MTIEPARKIEAGQVLPLLVLALVALLGFAALALDGGNLYTEQRRAQAAADNAVMAAAYQQMSGITVTVTLADAAISNAATNGYTPGARTSITFYRPPVHGAYIGNKLYMEVVITQTVQTALAHLVYRQNPIPLTVIAVAKGRPQQPPMPGYALAAMKPTCDGSNMISAQGRGGGTSGGTYLFGGGAFINATCDDALDLNGGDPFYTDGPPIDVVGSGDGGGVIGSICTAPSVPTNCNVYPAPTLGVPQVDQDVIASSPAGTPPTSSCTTQRTLSTELANNRTIQPGAYTTLDYGTSPMTMTAGIYCLTGGTLTGKASITGTGVMLYLTDVNAEIDFSGNDNITVELTAPTANTTGCSGAEDTHLPICAYLGIVVYKLVGHNSCEQNDVEIDFTGQASKVVTGLVYAPHSLVRYGGEGNLVLVGQTIAGCVKFNGNGRIEIYYDPVVTYSPPPAVELDQ